MWGEIGETQTGNESQTTQAVDLSPIIEQSRQKDCLAMYQISSCINETREINLPSMDPRMLYAAALHNYISTMTNVIEDAELAVEYNLVMPAEMPALEVPDAPLVTTNIVTRKPIHFLDKEYSSFSMGFGKNPPVLSESTRKQVETQCVATMLAHIGFMTTNASVLDILTDVFGIFMEKICKELRCANDSILTGESSGFSDIIEQVLMQNGLGGVRGICEYYERKIKRYEEVLKERCQGVASRYDLLVAPGNMQIECKTERVDDIDNEDIPEVHFTSEEGYLQPFLESGFQMLNSLEEGQL